MARRIAAQACSVLERISKVTLKSMYEVGSVTREWLDSLEDDQWTITSFDPDSRVVCFDVTNDVATHHFTLTLPDPHSFSRS